MKIHETKRDILIAGEGPLILLTAADSCAGIGQMPNDALKCPARTVGLFTARVPLMELLAAGGEAVFASLTVGCAGDVADELIEGARSALGGLPVIISTEKNMRISTTSLGVTVTARCLAGGLRLGHACGGDTLWCVGTPLVGGEVLESGGILEPRHVAALLSDERVHALIPAGSHGVAFEAGIIAKESRLIPKLRDKAAVDVYKSAGPATCAVFAAAPGDGTFAVGLPVFEIGTLI